MLIDVNSEYIHRVNGTPLFYSDGARRFYNSSPPYSLYATPSPPSCDFSMTSKILSSPQSLSPHIVVLTPPLSPTSSTTDQSRRDSVIMKVENCQITSTNESQQNIDHVCRWKNCYRIFDTLEKLANHVSVMHSNVASDNLYYCNWQGCGRTDRGFNARYKMLVHCRTHTKEKPHQCTFPDCKKSFSRAENLKIHIRSHTLEKPYKCTFPGCTKAYSNSSDRFKHNRTHLNTKPYCCKVPNCGKKYTDPSSLRKHCKTFNHENLLNQQKLFTFGTLKCNNDDEFDFNAQNKTQKQLTKFDREHLDERKKHNEIYNNLCSIDERLMTDNQFGDYCLVEKKMDTFQLNEPLDLRVKFSNQ